MITTIDHVETIMLIKFSNTTIPTKQQVESLIYSFESEVLHMIKVKELLVDLNDLIVKSLISSKVAKAVAAQIAATYLNNNQTESTVYNIYSKDFRDFVDNIEKYFRQRVSPQSISLESM